MNSNKNNFKRSILLSRLYPLIFTCFIYSIFSCTKSEKIINTVNIDYSQWRTYAGSKDGMRYSSDDEININNVTQLEVTWKYSSKDKDKNDRSQNQCNPIVIDGVLFGTSPRAKLFALDAETGIEKWSFDPASIYKSKLSEPHSNFSVIRGVVYWEDNTGNDKRIFYSTGSKTFCVNAINGQLKEEFGQNGSIDLVQNLDRDPSSFNPYIASTTPGIIYKNLLIISMRVLESADAAPGHIRAYDVRTGELKWIFHTIPHPGEKGYESWPDKQAYKKLGGANNWSGMSLDEKRGIVYVPTGSVSGDFYGGIREGQNLFANSLIALDAFTGKYIWHYQIVHHDLWDRDLPANPNLVSIIQNGDTIDAVAQITKHGYIFIFDRLTGEPVFDIEEKPVPQNALPGEHPWPTQPIPVLPEPFSRQRFTKEDINTLFPDTNHELIEEFDKIKYHEMFTPPSKEGAWIFPGFDGGGQWGGASVDPESQILYINSSELPWSLTMIDKPVTSDIEVSMKGIGKYIYSKHCMACHGPERNGNGISIPSLIDIDKKYDKNEIKSIITMGRNLMPAFKQFGNNELVPLLTFLLDLEEKEYAGMEVETIKIKKDILDEIPFMMTGYNRFLDKNGFPGISPPWGTLNAVDLNSGKLLWKVPLGEYPELSKKGIPPTGTENYGGSVVTKGGLVFIAATKDSKIRAFDKNTGKQLWEHELPVPGFATPSVYTLNGKQFVVIACGGGKIGSPSGDTYIAFSLPVNN
jgi:quinoprotein glucose dehydrogenase